MLTRSPCKYSQQVVTFRKSINQHVCYREMTFSISFGRDLDIGHWERFLILRSATSTAFQSYCIHLGKTSEQPPHWDPRWPFPIPRYWGSQGARHGYSSYLFPPPAMGRKNSFVNNTHTHSSLTLDPPHPDQLCKYHLKLKKKFFLIKLPYDPAIPVLVICSKELKSHA